jgi:hypothetical protein
MGALEAPVRTHELDASFMYAAGQGSAIAMRCSLSQTPGSSMHVMASWPSALPGHWNVKPGAE